MSNAAQAAWDHTSTHPPPAITPDDRFGSLPLFHLFGQAVSMGTTLRAGAA